MGLDESIVQLGAKLDQWIDGNVATFASHDPVAHGQALPRGFQIVKELDRLKADGLAAITSLLNRRDLASDDARAASLVRGFEFGAKLADTLHDELLDVDGETKVVGLMNDIATTLDGLGPGRAALAVPLDNPDARVRASAGAYLLIVGLMPERVVLILREIEENEVANSAHFAAHWALFEWELKEKARAK